MENKKKNEFKHRSGIIRVEEVQSIIEAALDEHFSKFSDEKLLELEMKLYDTL